MSSRTPTSMRQVVARLLVVVGGVVLGIYGAVADEPDAARLGWLIAGGAYSWAAGAAGASGICSMSCYYSLTPLSPAPNRRHMRSNPRRSTRHFVGATPTKGYNRRSAEAAVARKDDLELA